MYRKSRIVLAFFFVRKADLQQRKAATPISRNRQQIGKRPVTATRRPATVKKWGTTFVWTTVLVRTLQRGSEEQGGGGAHLNSFEVFVRQRCSGLRPSTSGWNLFKKKRENQREMNEMSEMCPLEENLHLVYWMQMRAGQKKSSWYKIYTTKMMHTRQVPSYAQSVACCRDVSITDIKRKKQSRKRAAGGTSALLPNAIINISPVSWCVRYSSCLFVDHWFLVWIEQLRAALFQWIRMKKISGGLRI